MLGDTRNTEQTNLAKVKVGDYLRVTAAKVELFSGKTVEHPNEVFTAAPNYDKGGPRKVTDVAKVKGEGWTITFDDGTKLGPRNGTTSAYRYRLTAAGEPIPDPVWPVCPTCNAQPDDPACQTASGGYTSRHKAREKLLGQPPAKGAQLPPTDADDCARGPIPVLEGKAADPERRVHDTARPDDEPIEGEPDTDGEKCDTCKGFGLVRGQGKHAGERYKTLNGAQTAQANGNAVDCPDCMGLGLVGIAA